MLYSCYTTLSSQPNTKYLGRSFQCFLLAPCKGIVENNGRFTKDVKAYCKINALFPVRQRRPHQELKACHRKRAAGRNRNPVLGREPAVALWIVCYIRIIDVEVLLHFLLRWHGREPFESLKPPTPLCLRAFEALFHLRA